MSLRISVLFEVLGGTLIAFFSKTLADLVVHHPLDYVSSSFVYIVGVYQRYNFMPRVTDAILRWEVH
jgi:hypothetical protein